VDISLARASTGVRVTRGGHVELLGQLPRSGNCPVLGAPFSAGIARARNGVVYLVNCVGNAEHRNLAAPPRQRADTDRAGAGKAHFPTTLRWTSGA